MNLDVNLVERVVFKHSLALNSGLNAILGSKGAWDYPDPDDKGRRLLASFTNTDGVETGALHPHFVEIVTHSATERGLPVCFERVQASGLTFLGHEVRLRTLRLDPEVVTRARNQDELRVYPVVEILALDGRGYEWGSGSIAGDSVTRHVDAQWDNRLQLVDGSYCNT